MIRRVSLLGAAVAATVLASACGSSGDGGGKANAGNESLATGPVTLTYAMFTQPQQAVVQAALDAFHAQHPNITVDIQLTANGAQYRTKLQTQFQANTGPDIYWTFGGELPLYAGGGVAQDLTSYIKRDNFDVKSLNPAAVAAVTVDGKIYGLPHSAAIPALWYNKKLFDAAGVKYPDASWTWQDVQSAAQKLTNKAAGVYGIGANLNLQSNYAPTILQAGGSIISSDGKKSELDSPACAQGVGFWTDMIQNGSSPTLAEMTETDPNTMFQSGKLAMLYALNSTADAMASSSVKSDVDVVPLPAGPTTKATTVVSVPIVMNPKTAHPAETWALMKFLTSEQGLKIQAGKGGAMPPATSAVSTWQADYPQYNVKAFVDSFSFAKPYPQSKNTAKWLNDITQALTPAWTLKSSPADACKKAAAVMNSDLASE